MDNMKLCQYCKKEIKGKPFIPVHSKSLYHWKCYINKIKEERSPSENIEEIAEESRVMEKEG